VVALGTSSRSWSSLRTTVVGELLGEAIAGMGAGPLRIIDAGGGTGGFAVPLAAAGHHVTVVDPSPDAMAALRRRAGERALSGNVTAVQGDLAGLLEVVEPGTADVVLCHNVLELVDDPAAALRAVHDALRPGGVVSLLVPGRGGAVLARTLVGRLSEARDILDHRVTHRSAVDAAGAAAGGAAGFTPSEVETLIVASGLDVETTHAIRVFSDHVPASVLDSDPDAMEALLELERAVAARPEYLAIASQLHVLARR
jgi:SAM-dependent methyltransferase